MSPSTVLDIWTELRLRHTLLGSVVEFDDYEDIRFAYVPPPTLEEARQQAETAFGFHYNMTKNEMLDKYLNGPRMLSDDKLAAFHITTEQAEVSVENMTLQDGRSEQDQEYNVWLFATHFIGDGMALHSMANEFFTLLQGGFDEAKKANALQWQPSGEVVSVV